MKRSKYINVLAKVIGYEAMRAGNPEYDLDRSESPCSCEFCQLDPDDHEWWFDAGGEAGGA